MSSTRPVWATRSHPPSFGNISIRDIRDDDDSISAALKDITRPLYIVKSKNGLGVVGHAIPCNQPPCSPILAYCPPVPLEFLGDTSFQSAYNTRYSVYIGAMAGGISSTDMIISLAKAGMLGSFGAGGLHVEQIENAIQRIRAAVPDGSFALNILHNRSEPLIEQQTIDLYLNKEIHILEASAFFDVTPPLLQFRASGLCRLPSGEISINHRIIAKISRKEIAKRFLSPASPEALKRLVEQNKITPEQAELAALVPVADDITVEADSGGHTDNRPLVSILPSIISLRNDLQHLHGYAQIPRVGAAGGIGTPEAALAAFQMGAAFIVTGSINQSCVEAGTSEYVRKLLSQADITDVTMAPAADMFELGVKVQVLKRGSLFAARATKLFDLYSRFNSLEELPASEREKLEAQIFKCSCEDIWQETIQFFNRRNPSLLERALSDPHLKMGLIFRWYLGMSSRWSIAAEPGREMDYQIWSGPSAGAFNNWVRGSHLAAHSNRCVVDINKHILQGTAYLSRVRMLELQGFELAPPLRTYIPESQIF